VSWLRRLHREGLVLFVFDGGFLCEHFSEDQQEINQGRPL
jgi:hypothetical protein